MRILAVLVALACFTLAVLYWIGAVQWFASHPGPHHGHAALFGGLGVLALIWLRFQSGKRATPSLR